MAEPVVVTTELLRRWPLPEPGSDKDSRGVVLVIGVDEDDSGEMAASHAAEVVDAARAADVVLLGPGMQSPGTAVDLLGAVVPALTGAAVVDAIGSAFVTANPEGLRHLDGAGVLMVNPSELARTLGEEEKAVAQDPEGCASRLSRLSRRTTAVVVCGGRRKLIASPGGDLWQVLEGGPGLGVSGSGDVQAGFVTGLLARGDEPVRAAVWGAYLHGASGERLAADVGPVGFLARELAAMAPPLLRELCH